MSIAKKEGRPEPCPGSPALSDAAQRSTSPPWERAAIVALMLLAALTRWQWISGWPLWFDEVNTLYRAAGEGLAGVLARIAADVQAPLYDLAMALVVALFGDGPLAARLPPLLAGVLLVPVVAALVRELGGGPRAVIVAAAWAALDPYLVRYGVEARPYSWLALFSALTLLTTLRLVDRRGRSAWPLALAGTGLVLCHYYGVVAYGAVLIYLVASLGALSPRLPSALGAAAIPLVLLGLWSPVALHQLTQRSMNSIYHSLDVDTALQILDAQGLTAPLAAAGDAPWLVLLGRLLLVLLVAMGAVVTWRRPSLPRISRLPAPTGTAVARTMVTAGAVLVVCGLWFPSDMLAGPASRLVKEGRALDEQNLAFLEQVLGLVLAAGSVLIVAGLCWPALLRRASASTARARPVLLLVLLLVVPLALVAVLGALGKPTLAVRNTLFMAPAVIVLAALGVERLPRQGPAFAVLALLILGGWSFARMDDFLHRLPWDQASAIIESSGAEPLAHPPWLARCIEYHGQRPWASVFGSYRPDEVAAWARGRPAVVLVAGFETLADATEVRSALQQSFGAPQLTTLRGLQLLVYRR